MRKARKRRAAEAGFTLIEVLVSLAIFGLVLAVLVGSLRYANRAWHMQESAIDRQDDLNAVQDALRRLIASAYGFAGDSASLALVGTLPRALDRPGLYDCALDVSGGRLVLDWRRHIKEEAAPPAPTETVLMRGVEALALAYHVTVNGAAAWQSTPPGNGKGQTDLIRIEVKFGPHDPRRWPPLYVATMLAGPPGS